MPRRPKPPNPFRWFDSSPEVIRLPAVDLLELKRSAQRRRVLEIAYETLNGTRSTRTVRPLAVTFFGPVWLLVA